MDSNQWDSKAIISKERRRAIIDREVRNRMRKIYGFTEQKDEVKEVEDRSEKDVVEVAYPDYDMKHDVSATVLSLTTLFVGLTASLTSAAVLSYLIITGINLAALAWFYG